MPAQSPIGRVAPVGNSSLGTFVPLILLVVVFYFLLIRPQRKRQQEMVRMQNSLAPGSRIMTTTGLFATVVRLEDEDVILELAPGVETRWAKAAIGRVLTSGEEEAEGGEAVAEDSVADTADTGKEDKSSNQS
ncbi:preprotein translocase subunit YajC [Microbispora sp. NPDC088329]|uniref:preprotein translocase subunit YajC n=1 Tax=unclassified Microbispora TaxID=2614687 RepID=UPI003440EB01